MVVVVMDGETGVNLKNDRCLRQACSRSAVTLKAQAYSFLQIHSLR